MSVTAEPVTPASVRGRFEEFGRSLTGRGQAAGFEVDDSDGVRLTLRRAADGEVATVEMSGTTEVYFLDLGGVYRMHGTAYADPDKWEMLQDFLDSAELFIRKNYDEEISERKGRVLSRAIRLGDDRRRVLTAPVSPLDRVRLLLGGRQSVRQP